MAIFKTEKKIDKSNTTKDFIIGYPEAEAEANSNSIIKLSDFFVDYLDIIEELNTPKFIISGRKGCGKTALGQHIIEIKDNTPNFFSAFIRKNDLNIEKIVQTGKEIGSNLESELLFKWTILVKLLKLISLNESVQDKSEIKLLKSFLKINSGYVDIDEYQITEIIRNNGFEIQTEQLRRLVSAKLNKDICIKGSQAPFYKLIPLLQETIIALLKTDCENENTYVLVFDDLDIGFKMDNEEHLNNIANLLRIAKDFNNNVFAENQLDVKVIILLRDDILNAIEISGADLAKLISSYTIRLNWWEDYKEEKDTKIRKFIDKRIRFNLKRKGLNSEDMNPWDFLFSETEFHTKTSFKYVLDHTFFRPRDLILFFQPISDYAYKIPLSFYETNHLLGDFVVALFKELRNELGCQFSNDELNRLFIFFRSLNLSKHMDYNEFYDQIDCIGLKKQTKDVMNILFDYSLILL
jgi:hypothetical protein